MSDEQAGLEALARMESLRARLDALEAIRDRIAALFEAEVSDPAIRAMWLADLKEGVYAILGAFQLLQSMLRGLGQHTQSCANMLAESRSRVAQAQSELAGLDNPQARALGQTLGDTFAPCRAALELELAMLGPTGTGAGNATPPNLGPVVRLAADHYSLRCCLCGQEAASFQVGDHYGKRALIYKGTTHSPGLDLAAADEVFGLLDAGRIRALHKAVKRDRTMEDGLDAYCPGCDAIYCRGHWQLEQVWDEGFLDCTWGTCPKNHRRIVDD